MSQPAFDPTGPAADTAAVLRELCQGLGVADSDAGPWDLSEAPSTFAADWLPRFAGLLRAIHPTDTCKLVVRDLIRVGLRVTEHAVERWLSEEKPCRPGGDAVVAAMLAYGERAVTALVGPEHRIARLLAEALAAPAIDRRIALLLDRRLAELGLLPGTIPDQGGTE